MAQPPALYTLIVMVLCPNCGTENAAGAKFCNECGNRFDAPVIPAREVRKTVTILFTDLAGSTALGERMDPEALRSLMGRYFGAMRPIIERHGGTVEKFIGDAIMAVFGIPILHEDDALRAVRAAHEMRGQLELLNLELEQETGLRIENRTGVNTGQVVAGDPSAGQTLVTGDAVNTAARLEQAAGPTEILFGSLTYKLVRDAVQVERLAGIDAKGKALPVAAWRLIGVTQGAEAHIRRLDAPMVGRERELGRLRDVWTDVVTERKPYLFTVLGSAGVGKSRLVGEFRHGLGSEATMLRGRCLPYGEGITYWPLTEIVRAAASIDDDDSVEEAMQKIGSLAARHADGQVIAERISTAVGVSSEAAPQEELFWAVRKLFESLAADRPLTVVFDDIHWAEATLLDLIEHIVDWSRDAPILLVCMARPELLEDRPTWGGGKLNAQTILLEPLGTVAAESLIDALPGGAAVPQVLRVRIAEAAEGNPLYVEEMMASLVEEGHLQEVGGDWVATEGAFALAVPPSIGALVAARLERLPSDERLVAERGSVAGRVFERSAVAALTAEPDRPGVTTSLMSLVRKELVRPEPRNGSGGSGGSGGDEAFRFRHLLIRDAAYEALPKVERAELHAGFADWLIERSGDRVPESGAVVGYHLEQAFLYRAELGRHDAAARELGRRASDQLLSAAEQAIAREDRPAAAGFYRRALDLRTLSPHEELATLERMARIQEASGHVDDALATLAQAQAIAAAQADVSAGLRLRAKTIDARTWSEPEAIDELAELLPELEQVADRAGDAEGRRYASLIRATLAINGLRWDDGLEAARRTASEATASGDPLDGRFAVATTLLCLAPSSVSATDALNEARAILATAPGPSTAAQARSAEAALLVLVGDRSGAQDSFSQVRSLRMDLDETMALGSDLGQYAGALLAVGADVEAKEMAMEGAELLAAAGDEYQRLTLVALQVDAMARLAEDIDSVTDLLEEVARAAESDAYTQTISRRAGARQALAQGDLEGGARLASEALALLVTAQAPLEEAEAMMVLAEVALARGLPSEAAEHMREAQRAYAAKGAAAAVGRIAGLAAARGLPV
ncbi:AAA family ATPase [soil metagenome]